MALTGQHEHNLDSKDRLTIPSRIRKELPEKVVLFAGFDPCVAVYAPDEFERFAGEQMARHDLSTRSGRLMQRRFFAMAHEEAIDSAGRVRLPKNLIREAAIEGECTIVGMGTHVEIWNAAVWRGEEEPKVRTYADEFLESGRDVAPGEAERDRSRAGESAEAGE